MKTIQLQAHADLSDGLPNNVVLRAAGVRRIHRGWYTVKHCGRRLDLSTVVSARRNPYGQLRPPGR